MDSKAPIPAQLISEDFGIPTLALMSALGYKPPWAGLVEIQPSSHELHALITPSELLHMTHRGDLRLRGTFATQDKSIYIVALHLSLVRHLGYLGAM